MNYIKILAFMVSLAVGNVANASRSCGFTLPPDAVSILHEEADCSITFRQDDGRLNYFHRFATIPLKTLMSDDTFISNSGGEPYFISEWADEPRATIHVLDQQTARPLLMRGMTGLQGRSTFFVQFLPPADAEVDDTFSGKLNCITAAGGTDTKSFKARFCTPATTAGKRQLRRFESVLRGIRPDQ